MRILTMTNIYIYIWYVYIYITEMKKTTESIQPAITPHRPCHLQGISTQIQWQSPRNFDLKWCLPGVIILPTQTLHGFFPRKSKTNCLGDVYCLFDSPKKKWGNFINLGNLLQDFSLKDFGALFNGLTKKSPKCKVLGCRGSFHSFGPTKA